MTDVIRRLLLPLSLLAAATFVLAGCGGSGSSTPTAVPGSASGASATPPTTAPTTSAPTTRAPTSTSTSSGVVQGVKLTADGSALRLGDTARVSWHPDQKTTGVIAITVTKLQRVPITAFSDWRLTGPVLRSTPYYVHATVRNLGTADLAGVATPLYLLDERNTLLEASTFRARFDPCPSRPLPAEFTKGRSASVCLVYFAPRHGRLDAISFRPDQDVAGITWRGHVVVVKQSKH
jgi:hypothetical protein